MNQIKYRMLVECSNIGASYFPSFDINKDIELALLRLSDYELWNVLHNENMVKEIVTKVIESEGVLKEDIISIKLSVKEFEEMPMFIITYHLDLLDDAQLKPADSKPLSPEMQERLDKTGLPF